jgi:hypothetical protein
MFISMIYNHITQWFHHNYKFSIKLHNQGYPVMGRKKKQCRLIIYKIDCHFIHRVLEFPNNRNLIENIYIYFWVKRHFWCKIVCLKIRRPFSNLTVHHFPTKEQSCDKLCFFFHCSCNRCLLCGSFPACRIASCPSTATPQAMAMNWQSTSRGSRKGCTVWSICKVVYNIYMYIYI